MTVAATGATTGARRTDPWRHCAMSYVMVDVESDGPIPGDAVIVEPGLALLHMRDSLGLKIRLD